jgi:hypothetical protein
MKREKINHPSTWKGGSRKSVYSPACRLRASKSFVLYVDAAAPRRLVTSMAAPSCSSAKALITASLVERHYLSGGPGPLGPGVSRLRARRGREQGVGRCRCRWRKPGTPKQVVLTVCCGPRGVGCSCCAGKEPSREGAGELPALLLDQGVATLPTTCHKAGTLRSFFCGGKE